MNEFFDLVANFFAELTNEEKILLGILSILVFLIGVIVGWIVQGSKTRRYKKELLLLRKDRDEYEIRYRAGETKQKELAKELELMSHEKVAALDRLQGFETQLAERDARIAELQVAVDTAKQNAEGTIASLTEQVTSLQADNERLLAEIATVQPRSVTDTDTGGGAAAGAGSGTNNNNESLNAYIALNESRLQGLEDRLLAMAQENAVLKAQGGTTPAQPSVSRGHVVQPPIADSALTTSAVPPGEPLVIRADTTEPGVRTGNAGDTEVIVQTTPSVHAPPVPTGGDSKHDDLTRIKDIGPFLQAELNKADIYSYQQIANWTEADIVTYTELIGYLPGIIQRDDWVGQAQKLLTAAEVLPTTAEYIVAEPDDYNGEASAPVEAAEDNLRIIEGIGPKIENVLKANGITTLDLLAETSAERLREILDDAGSRFKSHDPKNWPVQAGLAADGKIKELKAWQKELKAGR